MQLIPVIALIVLLLSVPTSAVAQSALQPPRRPPRPAATSPVSSTSVVARSIWSAAARAAPPSILEAGYRASARYWSDDLLQPDAPRTMVLPAVAEFTRVCAYDRPGTIASIGEDDFVSRSDPIAQPRTAPEVVADLHALLAGRGGPWSLRPGGPLAGWPLRTALRQHLPR